MPHHKSAEKRLRQTVKRTEINRSRLSRVRTFVKKSQVILRLAVVCDGQYGRLSAEREKRSPRPLFEQNIFEVPISIEIGRACTFTRGDRGCRKQLETIESGTPFSPAPANGRGWWGG